MNCQKDNRSNGEWEVLKNLPAFRYLKEPVDNVSQLYERYPDGVERGTFAFVVNQNCFYAFDIISRAWAIVGTTFPVLTEPTDTIALSIVKEGINGKVIPSVFSWMNDLTVKEVRMMSNAAGGLSIETGGNTYNEETVLDVEIPAGDELTIADFEIEAGKEQGNVIIIFKQKTK
jgi:hypothetical protein